MPRSNVSRPRFAPLKRAESARSGCRRDCRAGCGSSPRRRQLSVGHRLSSPIGTRLIKQPAEVPTRETLVACLTWPPLNMTGSRHVSGDNPVLLLASSGNEVWEQLRTTLRALSVPNPPAGRERPPNRASFPCSGAQDSWWKHRAGVKTQSKWEPVRRFQCHPPRATDSN